MVGSKKTLPTLQGMVLSLNVTNKTVRDNYLNWDDIEHRQILLGETKTLVDMLGLNQLSAHTPLLILDEIHKYAHWKLFLKGLFDRFEGQLAILITGSARLDVFKKGGDSLMGRYFNYRLHPFSVAELINADWHTDKLIQAPRALASYTHLYQYGGFPEPFFEGQSSFLSSLETITATAIGSRRNL